MNIDEITKLMEAMAANKLTSFEMKDGEFKLSLKCEKEAPQIVTVAAPAAGAAVPMAAAAAIPAPAAAPAPQAAGEGAQESQAEESGKVVTSPLVGTFYSASSPDAEPFVKVGDTVKKGQVLGIIEAMKLMNEIESEYDGVVEAVLVSNEQVVEYGQPLFRIR